MFPEIPYAISLALGCIGGLTLASALVIGWAVVTS